MFTFAKLQWTRTTPDTWTAEDFTILRWKGYHYGHTSQSFCYMVQYKGNSLTNLITWAQPHDLARAKRQAQDYSQLLAIRAERSANVELARRGVE